MDFEEYIRRRRDLLSKFEREYEKRNHRNPAAYPIDFPDEQTWDEQFNAWLLLQRCKSEKEST